MSLWNHPRLTAALCTVAVLGCAAAPAVFLAAADAASLGRVETVADPYVAPTPTADDYYILRQLAARSRNAESEREQRPAEVLTAPKMYIGASASLQSMQYADSAAAEAAENALRQLAETGAVPAAWAAEALDTAETGESYTDWDGKYYSLDATYCVTDSLGFVTVRRFGMTDNALFTRYSVTMDSRTGTVVEAWLSMAGTDAENTPLPTETAPNPLVSDAAYTLGDSDESLYLLVGEDIEPGVYDVICTAGTGYFSFVLPMENTRTMYCSAWLYGDPDYVDTLRHITLTEDTEVTLSNYSDMDFTVTLTPSETVYVHE